MTKRWFEDKALITFWVEPEDASLFRRACAAAGKTQSEVLRGAMKLLISEANGIKDEEGGRDA